MLAYLVLFLTLPAILSLYVIFAFFSLHFGYRSKELSLDDEYIHFPSLQYVSGVLSAFMQSDESMSFVITVSPLPSLFVFHPINFAPSLVGTKALNVEKSLLGLLNVYLELTMILSYVK